MTRIRRTSLVALAGAALLLTAACGSSDEVTSPTTQPTGAATVPTTGPATQSATLDSEPTTATDTTAPMSETATDTATESPTDTPTQTEGATTSAAPTPDFAASTVDSVKVDTTGEKPVITLKTPWRTEESEVKVLKEGKGTAITDAQDVKFHYLAVSGTSGDEIVSTFGLDPVIVPLGQQMLPPGMKKAIVGQKPGATVIATINPAEGWGAQGNPEAGIAPNDSVVMYLELISAETPLTQAKGTVVKPPAGLPTVKFDKAAPATITMPKGKDAPTELVAQQLIKGDGPEVTSGQQITVHYTGAVWRDGTVFDSSLGADRGQPATFSIGTGAVIPGWDEGLVGQPVGSRVLLVIPPDLGYGPQGGRPDSGIQADDTLVFVVDILKAQ